MNEQVSNRIESDSIVSNHIKFSKNAGIDNALKMREMFITTKWLNGIPQYWCVLDIANTKIKLVVGIVHDNGFKEREIATYYFNEDGTYYKEIHT